ncbi:M14 family metallopeptidase [Sedimentitalea sp.]|uniref:M14 family metallopeptidase n=1 Tax=Sedimentitalea sp. TaxID=2048915 RepID=UPI003299ADF8
MSYYNYDEIVTAVHLLAQDHPDLTTLIELPNLTEQSRASYALSIGRKRAGETSTVMVLGGVHAREWVPPDALTSLAADILGAAQSGTGLAYGGAVFSATEIAAILDGVQLILFPCVNPDGRVYSQTVDNNWRKNRSVNSVNAVGVCHGVDLNRNFDILWDFEDHFLPGSVASSSDPCHPTLYAGASANSEPETRNVIWLLDNFPGTGWFVDVHSFIPGVLHSWGLDQNQSDEPDQNFRNPVFDGKRGAPNDDYGEFLPLADAGRLQGLSCIMRDAATDVAGDIYDAMPAFNLYATSGASDDYAYSRHYTDENRAKILGFTIECGREFQPDEGIRVQNIKEICASILALLREATRGTS